ADGARAARHVLEHEALGERVLELVGVEAEVLPGSAGPGRRDHPHAARGPAIDRCLRIRAHGAAGREQASERADELTPRGHLPPPCACGLCRPCNEDARWPTSSQNAVAVGNRPVLTVRT